MVILALLFMEDVHQHRAEIQHDPPAFGIAFAPQGRDAFLGKLFFHLVRQRFDLHHGPAVGDDHIIGDDRQMGDLQHQQLLGALVAHQLRRAQRQLPGFHRHPFSSLV